MRHLPVVSCVCVALAGCTPPEDWSVEVVESTMARYDARDLPGWQYTLGLYLYAQYLVYQRTQDPRYLKYIRTWTDRFVAEDGTIHDTFDSLDYMMPGRVLNVLHRETGDDRYRIAAKKIRDRLDDYPRTSDGGLWHAVRLDHQLWADGAFMVAPFVAEYGREFDDAEYANEEAAKQLVVYASHLQQPNGLLKHAYDEARVQVWADPDTGLAPEHWCRAVGWFGMAMIHVLEVLPEDHPRRPELLRILADLVAGYADFQDPESGLWFEVVDKGDMPNNWTETSCSSMYTFTISRGIEQGWVDADYQDVADRGYEGVLSRISRDEDGLTRLTEIVVGTNIGDYRYYIDRPRSVNDFHGLGAFLIMNEQLRRTHGG
ncbi:glycoside hydrolase family 88 protein [Nannocystis sp.]|uniref:glycoside hydrolase family 88/105 protein n=1 Tax=Nannocystis sp. TaxID=1962667 RepID=UPI0025F2B10D|nr:glycoside hydrolase family 88 protein [Nannocystis sp.]